MAPMDGMLENGQQAHQEARVEIVDVHKRVAKLGCWRNMGRGWEMFVSDTTKSAKRLYGSIAAVGTAFSVGFSGLSMMFGGLALREGIDLFSEGENASVIGHWSEWTNMGLQVLTIPVKEFFSELVTIGNRTRTKELFDQAITNADDVGTRVQLYKNKLTTLRNLPASNYRSQTPFPEVSEEIDPGEERESLLYRDFHLRDQYFEIHTDLDTVSRWTNFREGWRVISAQYTDAGNLAIKVATGVVSVYVAVNFTVYGAGIVWSGMQAVEDLHAGNIPSIGGHVLEWADEAYTIVRFGLTYLGEIVSVGRKKRLVDLFRERMAQAEDDENLNAEEKRERFQEVMEWIVPQMSQGNIYELPSYYMYEQEMIEEAQ